MEPTILVKQAPQLFLGALVKMESLGALLSWRLGMQPLALAGMCDCLAVQLALGHRVEMSI
jgi:hypothetical protein